MDKKNTNRRPHGPGAVVIAEKPKNFKKTIKKLFSYLSQYKIALIIAIIFTIASTIFSIVGPKILGNVTTEIFVGVMSKLTGGNGIDFAKIGAILLTLLILYILSSLFSFVQGLIMTNISQKTAYRLRREIVEKINRMPFSYFDKRTYGETLSIITNDADNLSSNLNQSATQLISSLATIIGVMIMMFSINVSMTLITLLIIPLSLAIVSFIVKKSQHYFKKGQDYLALVNGKVEEMYSGQFVIRAFNNEQNMINDFEEENNKLYEVGWKSQFISGRNIGYVLISILGGYYAILGKITVGNIQSFIQYSKNFTNPINQIAQVSAMLQSMVASAERIFEFLENEEDIQNEVTADVNNIEGNIEFKNVKFGYNPNEIIIKDFNAKIKKGQKIAIVGPTGAGKTTIVKLLMHFYNVNDGEIIIDGHNIEDYDRHQLKGIFGMVLQDTWLFTGTIMENIAYGNLKASKEDVVKAAKLANVDHFIKTLPEGYDMVLNEETSNISLGQKQLLTIARAILADPKILILDEATSSVDTRTEVLIQKAMDELMKGRTSFIIAHRLSTIKNADLILVMNDGDIIEQGTHEELLAKNGFYANLYNSQFDLVKE